MVEIKGQFNKKEERKKKKASLWSVIASSVLSSFPPALLSAQVRFMNLGRLHPPATPLLDQLCQCSFSVWRPGPASWTWWQCPPNPLQSAASLTQFSCKLPVPKGPQPGCGPAPWLGDTRFLACSCTYTVRCYGMAEKTFGTFLYPKYCLFLHLL